MNRKMMQTQVAFQATSLSETFASSLGRTRVGPYGYAPDITVPEGPSTGGGVQAMQHMRLLPPQPSMPTLVVGHLNMREMVAELRTLEHVDAICRDRFKQGAPLDPAQYSQFLQSAQAFLGAYGMRVALVGPTADLLSRLGASGGATSSGRGALVGWIVGVVLLLAALGAAIAWFVVKK